MSAPMTGGQVPKRKGPPQASSSRRPVPGWKRRLYPIRDGLAPSKVWQHMRRNMGLRIISLLLAIGLWVFVNAGQHGAVESFQVPISYHDLAPGYVIVNQHPDFVKVQVSGPRTLLSLIDPTHLTVRLDLTGVGVGQASFRISTDSFTVPRQTMVTGISPSQIVLDIDKIVTHDVPVNLRLSGKVATGYKIVAAEVSPDEIAVKGPSKQIAGISHVDTEPVDVQGISASVSRSVALVLPSSEVRIEDDSVTAKVTLGPVITDKEFHDVPVSVRDSAYKFKIDPQRVNVVLRGPMLQLQKLDLSSAVYVEAGGIAPGFHNVPLQIDLPEGIQLVHELPDRIRLRMYREKQAAKN